MCRGNTLRNVTWRAGALGDKEEKDDKKEMTEEEEAELAEARREEEERRADKYRKMEEERETMRQGIRDKVRASHYLLIILTSTHYVYVCVWSLD